MPGNPDGLLLTDDVVLLDPFTDADVDAAWAGEDDQFVHRSCLPGPFTRRDIAHRIADWQRPSRPGGLRRTFAIREAATRRLVGGCELDTRPGNCQIAELSYWVFPRYRRRGYATRSAELVCQYAFDYLGLARVELRIEPTNDASLRVATKAGFRRQYDCRDAGRPGTVLLCRLRWASP